MSTRPPAQFHTEAVGGRPLVLIGATSLLDDYFTGLTADAAQAITTRTESVSSSTVNRWPGDPGFIRKSHQRVKSNEKDMGGPALPGRRFWCERPTGTGDNRRSNARQFNYIGTWKDLKAFARSSNFGPRFKIRNSSGKSAWIEE